MTDSNWDTVNFCMTEQHRLRSASTLCGFNQSSLYAQTTIDLMDISELSIMYFYGNFWIIQGLHNSQEKNVCIHVINFKEASGRFFFHFLEVFEKCVEYIRIFFIHFLEISKFK